METMWSPWRSKYIGTFKDEEDKRKSACFFCDAIARPEEDKELLVVERRMHCFAILNKFPYNNGHTLVAPLRHVEELSALSPEEMSEIMFLINDTTKCLDKIYKPHGFNVGANLGRAAGAGVPGHLHFHVIPRWNGDTSFMATMSDVKVVSVSLEETWKDLSGEFIELNK